MEGGWYYNLVIAVWQYLTIKLVSTESGQTPLSVSWAYAFFQTCWNFYFRYFFQRQPFVIIYCLIKNWSFIIPFCLSEWLDFDVVEILIYLWTLGVHFICFEMSNLCSLFTNIKRRKKKKKFSVPFLQSINFEFRFSFQCHLIFGFLAEILYSIYT